MQALPAVPYCWNLARLAGTWLGLKLFGRIDEATFRKLVLALLFISGAVLIF